MPTYEYKCEVCKLIIPESRPVAERNYSTVCVDVNCFGMMHKHITRPGIQFKGNGWYSKDYKKEK